MCFKLYMQTKLLADKEKCSSQLKPKAGLCRKTTWLFLSIRKIKEGAQVSGRKMDELITALMRRGRGTRMPLHHPALTEAGQPQSCNQTGRLQPPFNLSSLPFLSALHQGPAARPSQQLSRLGAAVRKSLKGTNTKQFYPLCCVSSAVKL